MNTDWYIEQGYSHKICEDYAIAGDGYVIVSDGCSSSERTDVGSRLLCLSAQNYLEKFLKSCDKYNPIISYDTFRTCIMNTTNIIVNAMGLPSTCLDATLLVAFVYYKNVYIYVYGDGYVMINYKDGVQNLYKFEYPQNAPRYMIYNYDMDRDMTYRKLAGENFRILMHDGYWKSHFGHIDDKIVMVSDVDKLSNVLIMSDGAGSFINKDHGKPIPDTMILKELTNFKLVKGEFVRRRASKALKQYAKGNIAHYDDLSIGGINFESVSKRKQEPD